MPEQNCHAGPPEVFLAVVTLRATEPGWAEHAGWQQLSWDCLDYSRLGKATAPHPCSWTSCPTALPCPQNRPLPFPLVHWVSLGTQCTHRHQLGLLCPRVALLFSTYSLNTEYIPEYIHHWLSLVKVSVSQLTSPVRRCPTLSCKTMGHTSNAFLLAMKKRQHGQQGTHNNTLVPWEGFQVFLCVVFLLAT